MLHLKKSIVLKDLPMIICQMGNKEQKLTVFVVNG